MRELITLSLTLARPRESAEMEAVVPGESVGSSQLDLPCSAQCNRLGGSPQCPDRVASARTIDRLPKSTCASPRTRSVATRSSRSI